MKTAFRFFDLPAELRDEVYSYLLPQTPWFITIFNGALLPPPTAQVCRQLRAEVLSLYQNTDLTLVSFAKAVVSDEDFKPLLEFARRKGSSMNTRFMKVILLNTKWKPWISLSMAKDYYFTLPFTFPWSLSYGREAYWERAVFNGQNHAILTLELPRVNSHIAEQLDELRNEFGAFQCFHHCAVKHVRVRRIDGTALQSMKATVERWKRKLDWRPRNSDSSLEVMSSSVPKS